MLDESGSWTCGVVEQDVPNLAKYKYLLMLPFGILSFIVVRLHNSAIAAFTCIAQVNTAKAVATASCQDVFRH
jgi:hypothetical protein